MQHKAKKALGQNFLKSAQAVRDIIRAGEVDKKDTVLEIGPGKGALTEALLETGATVVAIEKDRDLFQYLSEKFQKEIITKRLILIAGDALEFDPTEQNLQNTSYKLIANIPYNITGLIFRKFFESYNQPERMVLLVQKEVAERIVARDGKESILSISVKIYGTPKIIAKVPARYFSPSPKVDSAIIAITNISRNCFKNKKREAKFFNLLHVGFAHKRKVLIKNLEDGLGVSKEKMESVWGAINLPKTIRAEKLQNKDWLQLLQLLF